MALAIEDYALIGDTQSAALVGKDGSIDWLCLPRFDSGACFAALLGDASNGRWRLAPRGVAEVSRRMRPGTSILETTFHTETGVVRLTDAMPPRQQTPDLIRVTECLEGEVALELELIIRFDYGAVMPWVRRNEDGRLRAVAGSDALVLQSSVEVRGDGPKTVAQFSLRAGEQASFALSWFPSHLPPPAPLDVAEALRETDDWWRAWSDRCQYDGPYREAVVSSLVTLKALTFAPTGGIVAAPTTSLPEWPGGVRNWDYRYCWLRDATFTLYSLSMAGYREEAGAWRDWLLRAVAGDPSQLQIMYGITGDRRLPETVLDWLGGYGGAKPVRVGNAAVAQRQLDVYGEVIDALHQARCAGLACDDDAWALERALLQFLEGVWSEPDEGMWEVRGPRRHFTHSKVMAWVAFDRAVKSVEQHGLSGPVDHWRAVRDRIHADVCERGWSEARQSFTQSYGSDALDANLLLMVQVGFLPEDDPRIVRTVAAIERELMVDGFLLRYRTEETADGLPPGEGAFLACSFWLADAYALMGRREEAEALLERLLAVRNDVGLLAEEVDPATGRLLGNFPQAFSHVGLVNTAFNLSSHDRKPARERKER